MSVIDQSAIPSSADACLNIVHTLMCHRQGGESEGFSRRAIESLVKKLKEKRDELDSLIMAVTTGGTQPSICVTIQRTLDGRLQVAARKGFPHVIYAKIWRWPDVHKNEMKHLDFCQYGFELKCDLICVNPYHYERTVAAGLDLSGLSLGPGPIRINNESPEDISMTQHHHPQNYNVLTADRVIANRRSLEINQPEDLSVVPTTCDKKSPPKTQVFHQYRHPQPYQTNQSYYPENVPRKLSPQHNQEQLVPQVVIPNETEGNGNNIDQDAGVFTMVTWNQNHPSGSANSLNNNRVSDDLQPVQKLSRQPAPEFWCSIAYFELDAQVGETFKVASMYKTVTIDGYLDPTAANRFCLGAISNVHRTEQVEKSRLHIARGVRLELRGEGDIWLHCLCEHPVFVQSNFLDSVVGSQPGDVVHKIYPDANIQVFDLRQCHRQMHVQAKTAQAAAAAQAAAVAGHMPGLHSVGGIAPAVSLSSSAGVGVDDLRRLCIFRVSFVKGWGKDYPRQSIKGTPCWIEVSLHRALQLLDEVLHQMPVDGGSTSKNGNYVQSSLSSKARPSPFVTVKNSSVEAQIGADVALKCEVQVTNASVSWLKVNEASGERTNLTYNSSTVAIDQRYYAAHEIRQEKNNWTLNIRYVQPSDEGLYECEVGIEPSASIFVNLTLINATAEILGGDKEVRTSEPLRLSCVLRHNIVDPTYIFWYHQERVINYDRFNGTIRQGLRGSELIIPKAQQKDAGNYTCVPSNALQASVFVTVIPTVT